MFFNTHKKIAEQATVGVLNMLQSTFVYAGYINAGGKLQLPYGLWKDSYLVGFIFQLTNFILNFELNAGQLPAQKKGEIVNETISQIAGQNWVQAMAIISNAIRTSQDVEFMRGLDHAALMFGASTGRIKSEEYHSEPILKEALALSQSPALAKFRRSASSEQAFLGEAVAMVTINQHMKKNFL